MDPFQTTGNGFKQRFPNPPQVVVLNGGGLEAEQSMKAVDVKGVFNISIGNVAVSALDMPANVTDLSPADQRHCKPWLQKCLGGNIGKCANRARNAFVALTYCTTDGEGVAGCRKLDSDRLADDKNWEDTNWFHYTGTEGYP
mmetsp:Transcript_40015/g.48482  ORF Transcript_40015/g.48482 Transcript_40015/m.48482 type:complete len:142 (-) Transcript_40015:115-540(-)